MQLQTLLTLAFSVTLTGCQLLSPIPNGPTPISERLRRSRSLVAQRQAEAASLSLYEKAHHFEQRLRKDFIVEPYGLVQQHLKPGRKEGHLATTALFLTALSLKYGTLKDKADEALALRVINGFAAMDEANGLDGYLPDAVRLDNGRLIVSRNAAHSNAYTLLFFSFLYAYQQFDDPQLKKAIRDQISATGNYFLQHNLVLRDQTGRRVPHSNITPSPFQFSPSRCLDGLVLVESVLAILRESRTDCDLVEEMKKQRRKMFHSGYLGKIQNLQFSFLTLMVPTHSTDWVNFVRLCTLTEATDREDYETALHNLFRSQTHEHNPQFLIIYLSRNPDWSSRPDRFKEDIHTYLGSFPLSLNNHEIINTKDRIDQKLFPPFVKDSWRAEATVPLPIYRRPLSYNEWKRNPFRLDGNFHKQGKVLYPGTDFLLAYWMGRYYQLIDKDD